MKYSEKHGVTLTGEEAAVLRNMHILLIESAKRNGDKEMLEDYDKLRGGRFYPWL